jgi:hypothetical protein
VLSHLIEADQAVVAQTMLRLVATT